MRTWARYVRTPAGVGVVGGTLIAAAPDPSALRAGLASPERWVERDGLDLVLAQVVGAVAWVAALWLAVGFLLVAGSRLPGTAGRLSATVARRALPAGLRRAAAVALGASLATSALPAAGILSAAAGGRGTPSAAASTALSWPATVDRLPARSALEPATVDRLPARSALGPATQGQDRQPGGPATREPDLATTVDWPLSARPAAEPAETWPSTPASGPAAAVEWPPEATVRPASVSPAEQVDSPVAAVELAPAATVGPTDVSPAEQVDWPMDAPAGPYAPVRRGGDGVTVAPGDTLWSIASRRLGPGAPAPAVAVEWRRWHAANRTLIGPDPRRLRPGTTLRAPTAG